MMSRFDEVQAVAQSRGATQINSETWAKQIVASSQGDARLAYDFLDALNRKVTNMLQGRS
jgi:hypothetical protein